MFLYEVSSKYNIICFVSHTGISSDETEVPCESHKRSIIKQITKGIDESVIQNESSEENEQIELEIEYLEQLSSPYSAWLDDIVKSAKETVECQDDGDRDNVMHNPAFAKDFIRLCKILPLWSAISHDVFGTTEVTFSSSNVECDFKNVKQSLRDVIPCSVDVFVQEHIELLRGATIEASQQSNYVKFVRSQNIESSEIEEPDDAESEESEGAKSEDLASEQNNDKKRRTMPIMENSNQLKQWNAWEKIVENSDHSEENDEQITHNTSIDGCQNGGEPGGAHRCIDCDKAVHILSCCSISIGDEEGYGEKRLCNACARQRPSTSQSQDLSTQRSISEMHYKEQWNKTKPKSTSKYMRPAPNWNLNINVDKKIRLGILQNGNSSHTVYKVGKDQKISLTNTSTFDSICQVCDVYYICYCK